MKFYRRQIFYVAVTGATLALLGSVAFHGWIFAKNRHVRQWVQFYGGSVGYDRVDTKGYPSPNRTPRLIENWLGEPVFDRITIIHLDGSPPITVEETRTLARLSSLAWLWMKISSFSDDHAEALAGSESITHLVLEGTDVTNQGLDLIASSMIQLESLELTQNPGITRRGLGHLSKLSNLSELKLGSGITDADLKGLKQMPALTELHLAEEITDAGIAEIVGLENLVDVYFWSSKITDEGVDTLRAALPGLKTIAFSSTPGVTHKKGAELQKAGIRTF